MQDGLSGLRRQAERDTRETCVYSLPRDLRDLL
jgi:hypothetical protein